MRDKAKQRENFGSLILLTILVGAVISAVLGACVSHAEKEKQIDRKLERMVMLCETATNPSIVAPNIMHTMDARGHCVAAKMALMEMTQGEDE